MSNGSPAGRPGPPPGGGPGDSAVAVALIAGLFTVLVFVIGYLVNRFGDNVWMAAVAAVAVPVLVWTILFLVNRDLALAVRSRITGALKWAGVAALRGSPGAALAALVLAVVLVVQGWHAGSRPCGQPLELRVVTAPETAEAVRSMTDRFAGERRTRECRAYNVSVMTEDGPESTRLGFGAQWRRSRSERNDNEQLLGPQPDVWIPSSSAEYHHVPHPDDPVLTPRPALGAPGGGLGTSPMVLALFDDAHRSVADSGLAAAGSTFELLQRFVKAGVELKGIARPVPESSAAALAVTPVLHDAVLRSGLAPPARGRTDGASRLLAAERFLSPPSLAAPDAAALLCQFRAMARDKQEPPSGIAVVLPEQTLNDYANGRRLGGGLCGEVRRTDPGGKGWGLHPYYAGDLPTLDYPFIQASWSGQDTRARDDAVKDLRAWLGRHPLTCQGFRDARGAFPTTDTERGRGCLPLRDLRWRVNEGLPQNAVPNRLEARPSGPGSLAEAHRRIDEARPKVMTYFMLDVSGSMGTPALSRGAAPRQGAAAGPAASSGSRLDLGVAFLRILTTQLRRKDGFGLRVFSQDVSLALNVPFRSDDPEQRGKVVGRLTSLALSGPDLPLLDAIGDFPPAAGPRTLLMVTDGQAASTNPDARKNATEAARNLRRAHPGLRLHIVLTGPTRCSDSPVGDIVQAFGGACASLGDAPAEQLAAELLTELR